MKLSIALAQTNVSYGQPQENLNHALGFISQAAAQPCNIILFPELFTTGYDLNNTFNHCKENAEIIITMTKISHNKNIIIGGSFLERDGDLFNSFYLFFPDPFIQFRYRKIHLFRLMDEHLWLTPGNALVLAPIPGGLASLAVCYDLRFPEMFRAYALKNVKIGFVVAAWPSSRIQHWKILLRARAIENQMFIAAVNCVGKTGNETFGGYSTIVSPLGEVVIEGKADQEELLSADVDLDEVDEIRNTIPVIRDRRPDIYDI